jgi:hypothetical protein
MGSIILLIRIWIAANLAIVKATITLQDAPTRLARRRGEGDTSTPRPQSR